MSLVKKKILVVSHDAGGANLLAYWLRDNSDSSSNYVFILDGVAREIFQRILNIRFHPFEDLDEHLKDCSAVLCTTGCLNGLGQLAMLRAKEYGVYTISILDHWINYKERFLYKSQVISPDEAWVFDNYAYELARNCFSNMKIFLKENSYLSGSKINIPYIGNSSNFLYISQPIKKSTLEAFSDEKYYGYDEYDAFKYLISVLKDKKINKLTIRLHPSEGVQKLTEYGLLANSIEIQEDFSSNLIESLSKHQYVVGCFSYAMAIALKHGKSVYDCIPIENTLARLPHVEIKNIRDFHVGI